MKIKKKHSAGKEHKGVPVILSLPCYWDQTPLATPWAPAVSRISRSVYVHNAVSWPRHWKSKRSVMAGVAGALLNKHSTPVFLPPRPPLPFPSVYKHTLSHRHRKSPPLHPPLKPPLFMAFRSLQQRITCEKRAAFVPLTSHYYPVLSFISHCLIFPWPLPCALHLSLSCTHTLSVIYFHWVVFEGLMCFSPAMACLFFLFSLLPSCPFAPSLF